MIVRGTREELTHNREGQLAPTQRERLKRLPVFRLPYWPSLVLAPIFLTIGLLRGGTWIWLGIAIALLLLVNGVSRRRQQQRLAVGRVDAFTGCIERVSSAPVRAFEALLTIDGRQAVLLAGSQGEQLESGPCYRFYAVRGLASMPIVLAVETLD